MAVIIFIVVLIIIIVSINSYNHKRNQELIETVTSLDRGTNSELNLILKLLKSGVNHKTIFHDLIIKKQNDKFSQVDIVLATTQGIVVIEVKDYSGWIFGNGHQNNWTQGNVRAVIEKGDDNEVVVQNYSDYYPFGMQMQGRTLSSIPYVFGYQGEFAEYDAENSLSYFEARMWDARIARWHMMDPAGQFASPYLGMGNNPVVSVDPDGRIVPIIIPIFIGAMTNAVIQNYQGNINTVGDLFGSMAIGAASGAAGYGAGAFVGGLIGTGSSLGGAIASGAISGSAGGYAGGFILGAGNSWSNGSTLNEGIQAGFSTGSKGAISGAILGGVFGGVQYMKNMAVFRKGLSELGVNASEVVPATDEFLHKARELWYSKAPMESVYKFTVENVSHNRLSIMNDNGAAAMTVPLSKGGILTGRSNVYFHHVNAFSSAKRLFHTMGHEFVHVSQFASLAGFSRSVLTPEVIDVMEYHAYNYEYTFLGSGNYGGFSSSDVLHLSTQYPDLFNSLNYMKFPWTYKANYSNPF